MRDAPSRRTRRQAAREAGTPFVPLAGSRKPFWRSNTIRNLLVTAASLPEEKRAEAFAAIPAYKSRGHGRARRTA